MPLECTLMIKKKSLHKHAPVGGSHGGYSLINIFISTAHRSFKQIKYTYSNIIIQYVNRCVKQISTMFSKHDTCVLLANPPGPIS